MNLIIKKLTLDQTDDYLDFFDNRAFSDNNPNGPCYCTSPNMDKELEKKMVSEFGNDIKGTLRQYAVDLVEKKRIEGYLAYDGKLSIGWCNASNMDNYQSFIPVSARENKIGKTVSVVCFEVAPAYRGMGIATMLLERVCSDAKKNKYAAVEGYVKIRNKSTLFDYTGPYRLYEKSGFIEAHRSNKHVTMRKVL